MGYGNEIFILNFTHFEDGRLRGERTVVRPNDDAEALRRAHAPSDKNGRTLFYSFDAESETAQYQAYGGGLVHLLRNPPPTVDDPVLIGRSPAGVTFDYSHDTMADRAIVFVGFPPGWSANYFEPWPSDAKHVQQRLVIMFEFSHPESVQLKWQMQPPTSTRGLDAEVQRIKRRETGGDEEKTLVLFIHGLGGKPTTTWAAFSELLRRDEDWARKHEIAFFSYPTMLVRWIWMQKAPSIQELAEGLRTQISNRYPGFGRVVLVCHSLGGLIARKYLLDEIKAQRPLRVTGIVLLAVPNNGAELAKVSHMLSWRHPQVRQLCSRAEILELLNEDWYTMALPERVRAKYVIGTQDRVVDRFSAKGTWGNPDTETVVGKGHRDITKPQSAGDDVVLILKRFLESVNAAAVQPRPAASVPQRPPQSPLVGPLEAHLIALNQPVFEARVEGIVNEEGVCYSDRIIVSNAGAPISQVRVERLSLFKLRYFDMRGIRLDRTIVGYGYYNAGSPTGKAVGELFTTVPTMHRRRVHYLLDLARETPCAGYKVLGHFYHYLRIAYNDRLEQQHTREIKVDEFGYTGISKAEWADSIRPDPNIPFFDFDAMTNEQFLQMLRDLIQDGASGSQSAVS